MHTIIYGTDTVKTVKRIILLVSSWNLDKTAFLHYSSAMIEDLTIQKSVRETCISHHQKGQRVN